MTSTWYRYYDEASKEGARATLMGALRRFEAEGRTSGVAVDFGCGSGSDTIQLIRRGWQVWAIDRERSAFRALIDSLNREEMRLLNVCFCDFVSASWPNCQLVNAGLSLPFCDAGAFPDFWNRVLLSIENGGRFCGHFFGLNHDWRSISVAQTMHHSKEQIEGLFHEFEIEHIKEVEFDQPGSRGNPEHWHVWEVIARKPVL